MDKYDINGNIIGGPEPAPPPVVDVIQKPQIEAKKLVKFLPLGVLAGIFLSISIVAAFNDSFFDRPKTEINSNNKVISIPTDAIHKTSTPVISIVPSATYASPTPLEGRVITYSTISDWSTFTSETGYLFQYHKDFSSPLGEHKTGRSVCQVVMQNKSGGALIASIVPYNGSATSLKNLLDQEDSQFAYSYEYVRVQDNLTLLREKGPTHMSGANSTAVIQKGLYALIITRSNIAKNSEEFGNILKSIKITGQLNSSLCAT